MLNPTALRQDRRMRRLHTAMLLALGGWLALAPGVSAHERWFTPGGSRPVQPEAIFSGVTLLAIAVIAGALGLAWLIERLLARRRGAGYVLEGLGIRSLSNLYAWLPPILALHAAVPLIVNGVELRLFAPNLPLPRNIGGVALALGQIVVALAFLYGAFTRQAAVVLAVIGALGMFFVHPLFVLEHCDLLGIAAFLYITGRGPFSVDALIGRAGHPDLRLLPYAVPALRILTGFAVMVLGFTEKLWNRELARDFLELYPLNFTRALPITLSDDQFIIAAGLVEATVGALLISGLLTRAVILLAWLPFNLSVPLFGWVELVGHLPTYGTIAVLLIWGSGQNLVPYIRSVEQAERQAEEAAVAVERERVGV
jgi:uncharacterized membrane protein YphA (DoxX/SURF4 family)